MASVRLTPGRPFGNLADAVDIDEAIEMKDVHFQVGTFMPGWRDSVGQMALSMPDRGGLQDWQLSTALTARARKRVERRHVAAQLFIFLQKAVSHYAPCMGVSVEQIYKWLDQLKRDFGFYELSTETWRKMVDEALVMTALRASFRVTLSEEMSRRSRAQLSAEEMSHPERARSPSLLCSSSSRRRRKRARSPSPSMSS